MKTVIHGLEEGLNSIAEALGGGGSDIVPTPKAQDEGKVLTANDDGTASWENSQGGLPTISGSLMVLATGYDERTHSYFPYWEQSLDNLIGHNGNDGDVLTLNDGGLVFLPPQGGGGGLPSISDSDNGKVLQATYDDKSGTGFASWVTPSGGGGIVSTTFNVLAGDFVKNGNSYKVVFDSNGDYQVDMGSVISARIYDAYVCSVPCSITYVDKTGWIAQVTADDYAYLSGEVTIKIFSIS